MAAGQRGINEWHQSRHGQQPRYYHTLGPLLIALRLKGVNDLLCPKRRLSSRAASAREAVVMLLRFACLVRKRTKLVSEARPCNTLPQHYVTILFNMDVCMFSKINIILNHGENRMPREHRVKFISVQMPFLSSFLRGLWGKQVDLLILHIFQSEAFCSGTPTKESLSLSAPNWQLEDMQREFICLFLSGSLRTNWWTVWFDKVALRICED